VRTFKTVWARSGPEAVAALAADSGAMILAGGTDLVVKMKEGRAVPNTLVNIEGASDLSCIEDLGDQIRVGAACTHHAITSSTLIRTKAPLLAEACLSIGSPQIRNRGTIGGNLCTASPAGDAIAALVALEAIVEILGPGGVREIAVSEFLVGPGRTTLAGDEIVRAVRVPVDTGEHVWGFRKLGQRRAMSISIASVAARARLCQGVLSDLRVSLGSVAPTVVRAYELERETLGVESTPDALAAACRKARNAACPISDIRGSREYRLAVVEALSYQVIVGMLRPDQFRPTLQVDDRDLETRGVAQASWREQSGQTLQPAGSCDACPVGSLDLSDGRRGQLGGPRGGTIRVSIEFFGDLRPLAPGGRLDRELPAGSTAADLLGSLPIGDRSYVVVLVNMRRAFDDTVLADGDSISLMNPVGGGA
jgi:CO/xanthine dehydrogenase FAD-binding subunit/sulfur carrier protein ThiS